MKRIYIAIFTIIVSLFMFLIPAYSENFTDIKDDVCKEAVNMLSSYGIVNGYDDGTFRPEGNITRAEMAKIITVAAGYKEYSQNMTSLFGDMSGHWAEKYVELANVLNIVNGNADGTFRPDENVTYSEASIMIMRLLGYTDEALNGEWSSNYYDRALELGIFDNTVALTSYGNASRRDISIMLYNAMSCNLVNVKNNNEIKDTGKTLLSLIGSKKTEEINLSRLDDSNNYDYTNYLFNTWDVYSDLNAIPVYFTNPLLSEFSGRATSILSNNVVFITDDGGNVKGFDLTEASVVFNGALGNISSLKNAEMKAVYDDKLNNNKAIGAIGSKVTDVLVMDENDLYIPSSITFAGKYLPVKPKSKINYDKIRIWGDADSLEGIIEDDIVYFYETDEDKVRKSTLSMEVVRSSVVGYVTEVENKNAIKINDNVYVKGDHFIYTEDVSIGDRIRLVLDKEKKIAKIYILSYGKEPSTYGMVLSSTIGTNRTATVEILDQYGYIETYSLASNSSVVSSYRSGIDTINKTILNKNDFVKFDPVKTGDVKIINKQPSRIIASYFDENTKIIRSGNAIVTTKTFIIYETNGIYKLLKPEDLGSYIEGRAMVNEYGYVEILYVMKGLKTNNVAPVTPLNPSDIQQPNLYSGTILGVINTVAKNNSDIEVTFFNNSRKFTASSTIAGNISGYKNYYVKAVIVNDVVTNISIISPETKRTKVTAVYTNQIQIDGLTYIECSPSVKVYICNTNKTGDITNVTIGSKSDVKAGSYVQLYDINGSYDGVIDVIFIYK